jgi:hypothetical protein
VKTPGELDRPKMSAAEWGCVCIAITVVALSAWGTYLLVFE